MSVKDIIVNECALKNHLLINCNVHLITIALVNSVVN
jgi:hypothetical protein